MKFALALFIAVAAATEEAETTAVELSAAGAPEDVYTIDSNDDCSSDETAAACTDTAGDSAGCCAVFMEGENTTRGCVLEASKGDGYGTYTDTDSDTEYTWNCVGTSAPSDEEAAVKTVVAGAALAAAAYLI